MIMKVQITQKKSKGYKQTEIGVISEDWGVKQLKEVVSKVIDNRGKTPPYSDNANIELIETASISFVNQYPDYSRVTKFVSKYTFDHWFREHPLKGDVLISTVGEYSGASGIMKHNRGTIAQNLVALRIKEIDPIYVFYWTRSTNFRKQLSQVMMNQAQPSLRVPWLLNFYLNIPKPKEQTAIAAVLSDTDALLECLEKLIAKKKAIKQGTMQQLLTGKKRLPGFSEEWEVKKLGEVGETYGGLSGKKNSDFDGGKYPYIPFMNIMSNPVIDLQYFDYVNIQGDEKQNKAIKGDLFFNGSSETPEEVGMCSVLQGDILNLYLNSFCFGFRLNNDLKTDGLYLSYFFRSPIGRQLVFSLAQGATRYNLSKINFMKLEIPYPDPAEQTAIAAVLSDMDAEIESLGKKRDKYIMLKQGMMQQLLTGRIRIYDNN